MKKCDKCEQLSQHCMMFGCINPGTRSAEEVAEQSAWWKLVTN